METNLNQNFINGVCLMFKLSDKQLDILEGPFMFIARPILAIAGILIIAYWLITDIGFPMLIRAIKD